MARPTPAVATAAAAAPLEAWDEYLARSEAYLDGARRAIGSGRRPPVDRDPPRPSGRVPEERAGELLYLIAEASQALVTDKDAPTGLLRACRAVRRRARSWRRTQQKGARRHAPESLSISAARLEEIQLLTRTALPGESPAS